MTDTPDTSPKLHLRADLEQSRQQQQGKTYLVVKDPLTRRYFRFTESQAAIVELMQTPMDAETLAAAASEKLGGRISATQISAFYESLEKKQLADTPAVRDALANVRGGKLEEHNMLYWKLGSIDPERIFDWLLPRTQWAFRPAFHVFAALVIVCGFAISYTYWGNLTASASGLLSLYGFFLIWPVMFAVITVHEFAHGLTCRHFGGKVHEVGFMLIYFQPAFYCDVSDSWMFASRRDRMWVTFAGGYIQFVVWGLCTILWRVTDSQTFINQIAMVVVMFSGVQSIFNFNPLIKLDGYYMLSDYLEIPNLRRKAIDTLWDLVAGRKRPSGTPRELRAQVIFGSLAVLFSTSLLLYIYAALYTWATSTYALAGLLGFLMFSTLTLRRTAAESLAGVRAVGSRVALKWIRNLGIGVALLVASYVTHWELKISAPFEILAQNRIPVNAATEGVVAEVRAHENQEVRAGDILAILHDQEKEEKFRDNDGALQEARRSLAVLEAPPSAADIDRLERQIDVRRVDLANVGRNDELRNQLAQKLARQNEEMRQAQTTLDRTTALVREGVIAREFLSRDQSAVEGKRLEILETEAGIRRIGETERNDRELKQALLAQSESDLRLLKSGNTPQKIAEQKAKVDRYEKLSQFWKQELEKTAIRAPIDGIVVTAFLEAKKNRHLAAGEEFCQIVDIRQVVAELKVPEKEIAAVAPGSHISMKVFSFPLMDFQGRVDVKTTEARTVGDQQVVIVRSQLNNDDRILKPGMSGNAKIFAGEKRVIYIATRRLIRWINTDLWYLFP